MKFGVALSDFSASQQSLEIIERCNQYLDSNHLNSVCGFFENTSAPCIIPSFPIFPMAEIWGFDGIIIANDIKTADSLMNLQTGFRKYYYLWDLDWMQLNNPNFEKLNKLYKSGFKLLTRCEDYSRLIMSLWSVDCKVIEDFDIEKIYENTEN